MVVNGDIIAYHSQSFSRELCLNRGVTPNQPFRALHTDNGGCRLAFFSYHFCTVANVTTSEFSPRPKLSPIIWVDRLIGTPFYSILLYDFYVLQPDMICPSYFPITTVPCADRGQWWRYKFSASASAKRQTASSLTQRSQYDIWLSQQWSLYTPTEHVTIWYEKMGNWGEQLFQLYLVMLLAVGHFYF